MLHETTHTVIVFLSGMFVGAVTFLTVVALVLN